MNEIIILKSIRIISFLVLVLLCILAIPAFFLFMAHLIDGSPTKLDTFFALVVPSLLLAAFLGIRTKLAKKEILSDFSKIDYFLVFILIIGFFALIRVIFVFFHPINLSHGGRQINLPIEDHWATAGGGPSIKFFGGVKKDMSFSILDGHKTLWHFETEVYPYTINWRGGSITFNGKNNTVTFESPGRPLFTRFILVTPNIMRVNDDKRLNHPNEKIGNSPNGKFKALVRSMKNKMEFQVEDANQNILWKCEMKNCSITLDWKNSSIIWDEDYGTVIYDYKSSGDSYVNKFYLQTAPFYEFENKQSFVD